MTGVRLGRLAAWSAAAGAAGAAYMLFESQWLRCRESALPVPGLPPFLDGLSVLHISDVHAGQPGLNIRTLDKALRWARVRDLDLVFLTGDILGGGRDAGLCLRMLSTLRPRIGMFAVPGNHEYGLSKNPFAHRPFVHPWQAAGIDMLRDECRVVPVERAGGSGRLLICGADYLTGGYGLEDRLQEAGYGSDGDLALLLAHRPPDIGDPAYATFPVAFVGHTHGGQIRLPSPRGPVLVHKEKFPYVEGVHRIGSCVLVLSHGVGTSFMPFRLLTRPEVVLYRLAVVGTV